MPRLTIIGNSHVGALKEGWDSIEAEHPDWRVSFFAIPGPRFHQLGLSDDLVFGLPRKVAEDHPDVSNMLLQINKALSTDLAAADAVLWAGMGRPLHLLVNYMRQHDVEGLSVQGDRTLVTRSAFEAECDAIAREAMPPDRWLDWGRPVLAIHNVPIPAETLLSDSQPKYTAWSAFADRPEGQRAVIEAFLARYEAFLAARGVVLLRPPDTALLDFGLTAASYGAGSRRLRSGAEHPSDDHRHMNAEYGRLALAALLAKLPQAIDRAASAPARSMPSPSSDVAGQQAHPASTAVRERPARRRGGRDHKPATAGASASATSISPYLDLPPRAYWRSGVAERAPLDPGQVYQARFPVTRETRITTAGSCFAQHVGRALRDTGFNVLDAEPAPRRMPATEAPANGYGIYSGRYGNLYTARQLRQLFEETEGRLTPALPVWEKHGRFFDAQRPGVDPLGLDSAEQVLKQRESHLAALRGLFRDTDLFVFTFGLTEAWVHRATGTVYPTAPGTIAGTHDPDVFAFHNYDATEVLSDFEGFREALKKVNPGVRFLVTVSPVPLTATASGDHVEVATCYSKSTLRAVCGMLVARHPDIDYFPSFEIITSQNARGVYYEPNLRNVSPAGVATAMRVYLAAHGVETLEPASAPEAVPPARRERARRRKSRGADPCEDALLEAFAR